MDVDLNNDPLGQDPDGNDVFLHDIWPSPQEVQRVIDHAVSAEMFSKDYADVFAGTEQWQNLPTPTGDTFEWDAQSTYVRKPPYFDGMPAEPTPVEDISGARTLAVLGDSVTTDHISPGRLDQGRLPRRQVPARARRRPPRLQLLRLPPREPRGHDPRHVRQHPAAQPAGARHRGWRHQEPPDRRDDDDLRRLARLHRRRHPAGRAGRQGVRLGLVARLGGQGDGAARASRRSSPRATSASTGRT